MSTYKKEVSKFLDRTWQEDVEIEFVNLIAEHRDRFLTASDAAIKDYLRRVFRANENSVMVQASESFETLLRDLLN